MNENSLKSEGIVVGHMTIAKQKVYQSLAERLDKNPVGAVINETLFKILYIMYSGEEAEIGSKFPLRPAPLDVIAKATGVPEQQLVKHLDNMANKGLVIDVPRKGQVYYMLSPLVIGFFEYTFMRVTDELPMKDLAVLFNQYHHDKGVPEKFFGADTKLFQTLAYQGLMPDDVKTEVLSYEKAEEIIRDSGGGSLTMCYCRHQALHLGTNCDAPIDDICMSLGGAAQWLIARGFAKPATTDEMLRALEKAEQHGLVHLGDNVQNNPAYICNCCGCCCGVLSSINQHDIDAVHSSNFVPAITKDECKGCGVCAKRCQIDAIKIVEEIAGDKTSAKAVIDEERCIGCGVCIKGCKQEAIHLRQRDVLYVPPKDKKEQMMRIAAARKS
ncbi:4Fe-4S binding protein [Metallumcola ferriviriculae]|uniref:4Fe-4S binding protein n=1 Tax=Metallumcola ferriviriculae TaxID=3039180 RepID=A0AAU0UJX7_9FIRM|nr:4Fe-4S binding protein [Desulfitibacteraceae bacterium MK1]